MPYRQWEIGKDELSDLQQAALTYWEGLEKHEPLSIPIIKDFDLLLLPSQSLPTTHVVDVLNDGNDFKYRFWGSGFRNYLGYDGTGISTENLRPAEIAEPVRAAYRTVVESARPFAMISEFERGSSAVTGFQTFIRLPLADQAGKVGQIVSVVEFKMNNHEVRKFIEERDTRAPN